MAAIETETLRKSLREFITETFFVNESEQLSDSDSFMQKGIIDSTGVLELISFLEEQYHITIEDEDMIPDNLDSIDNLTAFMSRKLP